MNAIKMNNDELRLWDAICEFELDDDEAAFTFSDRLARENGWSKALSLEAIEEYKKFMFLICVTNQALTPSEAIDQVWHLHLLYTRSYWKEFCEEILKREIHHGPTRGGPQENDKFTSWYEQTLFHYRQKFNNAPPPHLWPSPHLRFRPANFRWIDRNQYWIIKKSI
jgi:hypothetical protein